MPAAFHIQDVLIVWYRDGVKSDRRIHHGLDKLPFFVPNILWFNKPLNIIGYLIGVTPTGEGFV